jgi:hypothetical protein
MIVCALRGEKCYLGLSLVLEDGERQIYRRFNQIGRELQQLDLGLRLDLLKEYSYKTVYIASNAVGSTQESDFLFSLSICVNYRLRYKAENPRICRISQSEALF